MESVSSLVLHTIDQLLRMLERVEPARVLGRQYVDSVRKTLPWEWERLLDRWRFQAEDARMQLLELRDTHPVYGDVIDKALSYIEELKAKYGSA